jgi:AraC-like DNA-binding protein
VCSSCHRLLHSEQERRCVLKSTPLVLRDEIVLESILSPEGRMGLEHRRGLHLTRTNIRRERAALIFPRRRTRLRMSDDEHGIVYTVNSARMLFLPAGLQCTEAFESILSESLTLFPDANSLETMISDNALSTEKAAALREPARLNLSRWMDDLIDRYLFERLKNHATPPGCPFFLEIQILNEFARLRFEGSIPTTGEPLGARKHDSLLKAIAWIESHVFSEFTIDELSAETGLSPARLNSLFNENVGLSPFAFRLSLRLEEAARLILRQEWSLTDIATIVGFSDLSAFSRAFRKKFGVPPGKYGA